MTKVDDSKLNAYNRAVEDKKKGLIADVRKCGLSVNWQEPGEGGQYEDFGDDLTSAMAFLKNMAKSLSNERYAQQENFPSLHSDFVITYNDGRTLSTFDTLIDSYDSQRMNF